MSGISNGWNPPELISPSHLRQMKGTTTTICGPIVSLTGERRTSHSPRHTNQNNSELDLKLFLAQPGNHLNNQKV